MKRIAWIAWPAITLSAALVACTSPAATTTTGGAPSSTSAQPTSPTTNSSQPIVTGTVAGLEATVESIYTRVNLSVVNISVTLAPSLTNPGGGALGSGFVWDTDGHIVTNNHVVSGSTSVTVTFYDGTTVDATVVGTDADSDLGVIKVNASSSLLKPVTLGDSTQLKVGQMAIAIGNPFGLQGTMTVGFVSGLGRLLPTNQNAAGPSYSIPDVVQTDAAINPGNSGGVLLDDAGRVIGVTSSIATTTGTSAGVGFAIPSAIVQQVVPALIKSGKYDHPYLGISLTSLTPTLAKAMTLPADQRGALVETVTAGGPASKAGVQASTTPVTVNGNQVNVGGDLIIGYNGQTVKSSDDLIAFLARSGSVGQTVTLTVLRGGKQTDVPVTLGVRPTS